MDFKKKKLKIINFYNPMKNKIKNRKAECQINCGFIADESIKDDKNVERNNKSESHIRGQINLCEINSKNKLLSNKQFIII